MDKKKILIVCKGFYPIQSPRAFRATELAKEFVKHGHDVTVLTPSQPKQTEFSKQHNIEIKDLGKASLPSIDIDRKNKWSSLFFRLVRRMLQLLFEYPDIELMFHVARKLKKEKGYDLMISVAVPYPIHWGTALARKAKHRIAKIWIADCGDPYMGDRTDSFRKLFYFRYIEKWFMRKTDYVTIPIEEARQAYYPEFHRKIRIIPQGFNFELQQNKPGKVNNTVPTFVYAGSFILGIRDPRQFLDILTQVDENFKFIVYTKSVSLFDGYTQALKEKLEVKPYIPRNELIECMKSVDFLVNFDNNTAVQSPSKLIDYALAQRPVLNITNKIDEQILIQFIRGNYKGQYEIKGIERFHIKNVANNFLKLLN